MEPSRQFPRRIPVEQAGFLPPLPPRRDPDAMVEPPEGTRQPEGVKRVVGAIVDGLVPRTTIDPRTVPLRATQPFLTRGSLQRSLDNPRRRGRCNGGGPSDVPAIYRDRRGDHYVLDGHHRVAAAMMRGEPIEAVVAGPEHEPLAQESQLAREHVSAMYGERLNAAQELARSRGKALYGRDPDTIDHEARAMQQEAFRRFYPASLKNGKRRELGLPSTGRRGGYT